MGSDDGVKGKNLSLRQWRFVAVFFAVVCALLVAEQRLAATRSARRSLRAGLRAAAVPPSPLETSPRSALLQPPPLPRALRPAPPLTLAFPLPPTQTPPNPLAADPPAAEVDDVDVDDDDDALRVPPQPRVVGPKSLKRQLLDLAWLPPLDALAVLDGDLLGVESVTNASDWTCPERRLLSSSPDELPSAEALANLRSGRLGAFVWFDHLSKAGGTSFCEFARRNLGRARTPPYYCMPSDDADIRGTDGRVGRWSSSKLREYVRRTRHAIVANEWDAFPRVELDELRSDAVLATVVRDPLDRLVSAYKFWGVLHNPSKTKPPMARWLAQNDAAARRRPHAQFPHDFLSQVARNNFATWKFASAGTRRFDDCAGNTTCAADALERAIDTLERFHIAVPTKWQTAAAPLYAAAGWTKLDEVHVVPSGKVQDASHAELDQTTFTELREKNYLDFILWAWTRRAFLERLHCPPAGA